MVTADTMKGRLSALSLKKLVVPAVIIKPQHEKEDPRENTEENDAYREVKHGTEISLVLVMRNE
jgi:hypothetical protein